MALPPHSALHDDERIPLACYLASLESSRIRCPHRCHAAAFSAPYLHLFSMRLSIHYTCQGLFSP